jgi:hypothetical protein
MKRLALSLIGMAPLFLAAACTTQPTPVPRPTPSPTPTPGNTNVSVSISGQVVDFDTDLALAGAVVRTSSVLVPESATSTFVSKAVPVPGPASTVTDADGGFAMTAIFPAEWKAARVAVVKADYHERRDEWTLPAVSGVVLRAERVLRIEAGQTIEANGYSLDTVQCGWNEDVSCRRIVVVAAPGELVELEAIAIESGHRWGLVERNFTHAPAAPPSRITVPAGDAYILPLSNFARVRITARKP